MICKQIPPFGPTKKHLFWLVVPTPWNILVNWDDYSQYMEKQKMFQTTNPYLYDAYDDCKCQSISLNSRHRIHIRLNVCISHTHTYIYIYMYTYYHKISQNIHYGADVCKQGWKRHVFLFAMPASWAQNGRTMVAMAPIRKMHKTITKPWHAIIALPTQIYGRIIPPTQWVSHAIFNIQF